MFPQNTNGNLLKKAESWDYSNCAETNPWIYLLQWRQDLPIKDACNLYGHTTKSVPMRELSADNGAQYEKDLPTLLNLMKNQYQFHDETNKDILQDREVNRFAKLYNLTNVCPVLSSDDTFFWLKDPDGIIYLWSRTDELMIHEGCDMKEALINFLFHQENLYINEYTHELISVKN